jgi:hypothetical protein
MALAKSFVVSVLPVPAGPAKIIQNKNILSTDYQTIVDYLVHHQISNVKHQLMSNNIDQLMA